MPSLTTSSPESGFTPRREFIREQKHPPNTFSLLAIASSNCIRLYSFPKPVIASLRQFFDQRGAVSSFREDVPNNFCEFVLAGKPWANAKSIATERLLVEILGVIYQHGYAYLSTIDYGREHDDRLAMTFSRPLAGLSSRSDSPAPLLNNVLSEGSKSTLSEFRAKRVPFALSFPSSTLLRVISPPLHSTPAILQAVRGAWPRGVVSEKKVGENSFEFKLKGYKWFQEDTFATDSLQHILSLLSSLDTHSFSLLTSISLTNNRSRVKDLWIFTGPAPSSSDNISLPDSPAPSILNSSHADFTRGAPTPNGLHPNMTPPSLPHRRLATEPAIASDSALPIHTRAATDTPHTPHPLALTGHTAPVMAPYPPSPTPSNLLRKPAPRAQVPVSVHDADPQDREIYRANLPSTVTEGAENMTGVGALPISVARTPDVFYSTSPFGQQARPITPVSQVPAESAEDRPRAPSRSASPAIQLRSPSPAPAESPLSADPAVEASNPAPSSDPGEALSSATSSGPVTPGTPAELLGPNVFRDSAFSSNSDFTTEIPIKWTGSGRETLMVGSSPAMARMSTGPTFPGGWQPTPIEEKPEPKGGLQDIPDAPLDIPLEQDKTIHEPLQEVTHRVASPELTDPNTEELRKSETGLVEMMAATSSDPAIKGSEGETSPTSPNGKGWVLVNVEGKTSPTAMSPTEQTDSPEGLVPASPKPFPTVETANGVPDGAASPTDPQASMSPAAKAIVIIDAVDAKNKPKSKSKGLDHVPSSPSRIRRLFSLGRDSKPSEEKANAKAQRRQSKQSKSGVKQKLFGTPEAARTDDRRSIDG